MKRMLSEIATLTKLMKVKEKKQRVEPRLSMQETTLKLDKIVLGEKVFKIR